MATYIDLGVEPPARISVRRSAFANMIALDMPGTDAVPPATYLVPPVAAQRLAAAILAYGEAARG